MTGRSLALAVAGLALLVPAAAGHVQVTPAVVAPADAVMFTVIVPNERDVPTIKVQMEVPEGVLPFSFEEVPGWTRSAAAASGGPESIVWEGQLPPESFVRFAFLASTPDAEGTLAFRTVQTYADGQEAAWIGAQDADEPAPVVEVRADAPAANAGGEGEEGEGQELAQSAPAAETSAPAPSTEEPPPTTTAEEPATETVTVAAPTVAVDDDGSTVAWLGLALGAIGLVAGVAALGLVLTRRRQAGTGGPEAW